MDIIILYIMHNTNKLLLHVIIMSSITSSLSASTFSEVRCWSSLHRDLKVIVNVGFLFSALILLFCTPLLPPALLAPPAFRVPLYEATKYNIEFPYRKVKNHLSLAQDYMSHEALLLTHSSSQAFTDMYGWCTELHFLICKEIMQGSCKVSYRVPL